MADLTPEELASMLAKLDDVVRQAQELQAQIRERMTNQARRDQKALDWSDRRSGRPERRKRKRA